MLERFRPDVVIGACGQDASAFDGNGRMNVSMDGFHEIGRRLRSSGDASDARLLLVQEGGYARTYAAYCLHATLEGVLGTERLLRDPIAFMPDDPSHASADIDAVCGGIAIGASREARIALRGGGVPRTRPPGSRGDETPRRGRALRDEPGQPLLPDRLRVGLVPAPRRWGSSCRPDDERLVFLDYERHETLVRETALFDDAVFYRYEDALESIAAAFREHGWHEGSVGIEWWTQSPGAPLVRETAAHLQALGARIVDGDWIVDRVRAVKSAAEIACVRRAAEIVDAAFTDLLESVRPGQTELRWRLGSTRPWRTRAASRQPSGRWSPPDPTSGAAPTRRRRGVRWRWAT